MFDSEAALVVTDESKHLIRGPTDAEARRIRETLPDDADDFVAATTAEQDQFTVFTYERVGEGSVRRSESAAAGRGDGAISDVRRYEVNPARDAGKWTISAATSSGDCMFKCMSCITGLGLTAAGGLACLVGRWIACAAGLIAGGLITIWNCPDCYRCAT